jgi:hypothetical protein
LIENFTVWFAPFIFSTNANARRDIKHSIAALFPSKKFERLPTISTTALLTIPNHPTWIETLKEAHIVIGKKLLQFLLDLLPTARDKIIKDFPSPGYEILPSESYRIVELLDLIHIIIQALDHKEPLPQLEIFFHDILPHTHAYDWHLKALLRIAVITGIPDDLLFSIFRPVPFDKEDDRAIVRGLSFFDSFATLFKNVSDIPTTVVEILLQCFIFVPLKSRSDTQIATSEVLTILVAKNKSAVLTCLDSDFDKFANASLYYVVTTLLKADEQRPVLKYWKNNLGSSIFANLIAVHTGPIESVQNLVEIIDHPATSRETRDKAWKLVELNDIPADQILEHTKVNLYKLAQKAKLWLKLPTEERDLFLLIASLNSFKALMVAFDVIKERLLDGKIVELILKGSFDRKKAVTPVKANEVKGLSNYWAILSKKKILARPFIQYGKAVAEKFGKEKVVQYVSWFLTAVTRNLEFIVDVLEAPKQKAITVQQLDGLITDFTVVRELGLNIDHTEVIKLMYALRNPEIVEKLEYQNAPALIEAASNVL